MCVRTYIASCPYCGCETKVPFSENDGTPDDYILWSDGRIEGDLLVLAYTQQCPTCGKFFTMPPVDTLRVVNQPCEAIGALPYQTLKIAIQALAGNEVGEARARLETWWAFNALYKDAETIPAEEQAFNRENMQWLLDYNTAHAKRFSWLVFELNRLLGNKEVCEQIIKERTYEQFVTQHLEWRKEKGLTIEPTEENLKRRYESQMKELNQAMSQPLVPYAKYSGLSS